MVAEYAIWSTEYAIWSTEYAMFKRTKNTQYHSEMRIAYRL